LIDGVKLTGYITKQQAESLLFGKHLDFHCEVSITTGEIIKDKPYNAEMYGMRFLLSPSTINNDWFLNIQGSIHKFYTRGRTNANDFYYWQFKEAVSTIESLLNFSIMGFDIRNIEIGVNIRTGLTAKNYTQSLISDGLRPFIKLNTKSRFVGKEVTKESDTLKVYDKGKQAKIDNKHMLRVEVKYDRMRPLQPIAKSNGIEYYINKVADLFNPEKIGLMGRELISRWENLIYYDGGIDETKLTPTEQIQLLKFKTPQYWETLTRNQRYYQKQVFKAFLSVHGANDTHKEVAEKMLLKWRQLVNRKQQKLRQLPQLFNESEAQKIQTFATLECTRQTSKTPPKILKEKTQKNSKEKRFCAVCGADISAHKKTAVTCSRKCRNKKSNKARTERNKLKREHEQAAMLGVLEKMKTEPLKLFIEKVKQKRAKAIFTNEVKPMIYKERRKINRVRGNCGGVAFEFTTMRAKEFIKHCLINK